MNNNNHQFTTTIQGSGNYVQTIISNLDVVATTLNLDPLYILRFLGEKLGAPTFYNSTLNVHVINGSHDFAVLYRLLDQLP
jgi:hypothetical protein